MFIEATQQGPLHGLLWEAVSGIVLSIGGYIVLFPIRTLFGNIKAKWDEQTKTQAEQTMALEEVKTGLSRLGTQGDKQIDLLSKAVNVLDAMHLSQVEMTGFMKGSHHE